MRTGAFELHIPELTPSAQEMTRLIKGSNMKSCFEECKAFFQESRKMSLCKAYIINKIPSGIRIWIQIGWNFFWWEVTLVTICSIWGRLVLLNPTRDLNLLKTSSIFYTKKFSLIFVLFLNFGWNSQGCLWVCLVKKKKRFPQVCLILSIYPRNIFDKNFTQYYCERRRKLFPGRGKIRKICKISGETLVFSPQI